MAGRRNSSASSGKGLRNILSGSGSHQRNQADRNSIGSRESSGDTHERRGLRTSIESAINRMRHDEGEEDEHGLKKLVPQRIRSKRRRKREEEQDEQRANAEVARGKRVAARGTLDNDDKSVVITEDDNSSLLTYESETESIPESAPPLLTRPSHIGYLTTSSPSVQATTLPHITHSEDHRRSLPSPSNSFAAPSVKLASSDSTSSLASSTLQAPSDKSKRRSPSPVGRLKEALVRRGSNNSLSPERKPKSGSGLGIAFQEDKTAAAGRRSSVSSRLGNIFPVRQTTQPSPTSTSATSSPERSRQTKLVQVVTTDLRPSTPPSNEIPAPVIVNTPPTPVESSNPRFSPARDRHSPDINTFGQGTNVVTSPTGSMISHRRNRTNSASLGPSKLSNITSAPLTPTLEGSVVTPGQTGFFSTVFSAAQTAANTLSNSIANTTLVPKEPRSRSNTQDSKQVIDDVEVESAGDIARVGDIMEEKEPAVRTMGQGDLNLSHLGISETPELAASARFSDSTEQRGRTETTGREDMLGFQRARTEGGYPDTPEAHVNEESSLIGRPRSMYEPSTAGDQTPPNGSVYDGKTEISRRNSVRSAMGHTSRRKRNSSAATGTTIGTAIAAASASVVSLAPGVTQPKLTGFAVASKKRNRDFHQLFRSVPDDDYLIEDYSCALQREILAHGRLYVSEGHLCFSSNIFGWVTTLVMSFDEIVSVEKRSTALLFKNGLEISTLHAKNVFASFTSRDSTYDLIVGIWKLGHPSLRSSLNGVRIDETGGGDRTEKIDGNEETESASEDDSDEGDDVYDEDDDEEDTMSETQNGDNSVVGSDSGEKITNRKVSAAVTMKSAANVEASKTVSPGSPAADFPGPAAHGPTSCSDQETHYDKVIADEVINAPLGKVYNLLFGPASGSFMSKWLTTEQRCLELLWEDKKALQDDHKIRSYSYIKPLNGSIGPKQTKCLTSENLDAFDLEKAVSVTMTTQTPDVPSGNVFSTKTRYCLTWAEANSTRLQVNCTIEWTGKSWLKGPIEKGAGDGQASYAKDLVVSLKAAMSSRARAVTATSGAGKGKKKGRKGGARSKGGNGSDGPADNKPKQQENWGLLEPLRPILEPLASIVQPLLSGNMVYGLLVGLLVAAWFGWGRGTGPRKGDMSYFSTPDRIAAYEEIWRSEESELWDWLEERASLDRIMNGYGGPSLSTRMRAEEAKGMADKLRKERVSDSEVEVAIRVTEEKLRALKSVVEKAKGGKRSTEAAAGEKAAAASEEAPT